jgi:hypothetical protein
VTRRRRVAPPKATALPDVRDGLTPLERAVLVTLAECQAEFAGRPVPTALLYGRLCERVEVRPDELVAVLSRLTRR